MHRIDTPTAQADKFGPGKNGFTNGDPATGRRATDLNSDMWDAVQEEICAVIEKSGLALNKEKHDQLYQAIVKIITSKIPDALLKKNNLSDLADKALARANLQLKTAAQKDIVTSTTDTTADRVPVVGWQGLGSANQFRMGQVSQFLAYAATDFKEVPSNGAGWQSAYGLSRRAQAFMNTSGIFYSRFSLSDEALDVDTPWAIHYTTLNKPTAADVGALPLTGGTLNGGLTIKGTTQIGIVGSGILNIGDNDSGLRSSIDGQVDLWSNSAMVGYWNKTTFSFTGQIIPTNYSNFDSRYISTDGATYAGFVSGDAARPYMRHRVSNAVVQLAKAGDSYTKAESDNGYMAKTGAYTKGESDTRYQLKNTASRGANGWFKDTTTGMIFQWGLVTLPATNGRQTSASFSFPTAFPNAALTATVTPANTGVSNNGYVAVTAMTALSASGGTISADSNSGESFSRQQTIRYIAIGY
ncbi:gp53-like domain-containing protein [Enterobacter cloacae]|uniref:gp53-like domain-containing protein n=1 Tax=Enterobacter cloacae TaxID=550 RepID=UPI00256EA277|nr:hypothetical protein [Enterobacter cloacae]